MGTKMNTLKKRVEHLNEKYQVSGMNLDLSMFPQDERDEFKAFLDSLCSKYGNGELTVMVRHMSDEELSAFKKWALCAKEYEGYQ